MAQILESEQQQQQQVPLQEIDPSTVTLEGEQPSGQQQQQQAPLREIDPSTVELLPLSRAGIVPDFPRLETAPKLAKNLGVGRFMTGEIADDAGRARYLSNLYGRENVRKNSEGDFVVKEDDGSWYLLNGKNFRDKADAWSATKGLVKGLVRGLISSAGYPVETMPFEMETLTESRRALANKLLPEDADSRALQRAAKELYLDVAAHPITTGTAIATVATGGIGGGLATSARVGWAGGSAALRAGLPEIGKQMLWQAAADGAKYATVQAGVNAANAALGRGLTSSFGRVLGTFDGDNAEIVADMTREATMSAALTTFMLGVKPSLAMFAAAAPKQALALRAMPSEGYNALKKVYSTLTRQAPENMDVLRDHGDLVGHAISVAKESIKDGHNAMDTLVYNRAKQLKTVAEKADDAIGYVYRGAAEALQDAAPANMNSMTKGVVDALLVDDLSSGLLQLEQRSLSTDAAGKIVKDKIHRLSPAQATELIAKNGGEIPKGYNISISGRDSFIQTLKNNGLMADMDKGLSEKSYEILKDYYTRAIHLREVVPGATAREHTGHLLELNRQLSKASWELRGVAKDSNLNSISNFMSDRGATLRDVMMEKFNKVGLGSQFKALNDNHNLLMEQALPFRAALKQSEGTNGLKAFESLARNLTSPEGRTATGKWALADLPNLIQQFAPMDAGGKKVRQQLAQAITGIKVHNAAIGYLPATIPGLFGTRSMSTVAGLILTTGQPHLAAGIGSVALATSPAANRKFLNTLYSFRRNIVQPIAQRGWNTLDLLPSGAFSRSALGLLKLSGYPDQQREAHLRDVPADSGMEGFVPNE